MKIPDSVLHQHIAVLGKTGSGKTSTEKLLIEQVYADGFRVCVLDTIKSDWWGITSSGDGKRAGLPFKILGGPRGHVPLHSNAGSVIGQLVGSGKLPHSIIDMADFEMGGIQKFFCEFAPALMRHSKGVLYLVIEEAHELAPKEMAGFAKESMTMHWAKKLATAGRTKGIRLIVATQRIQALHNAVLGSCETLIAHRIGAPADQEPVLKWLKANTDKDTVARVSSTLSSLPTGTGWICSGEAKIFEQRAFPKFKTYDNTSTPTGDVAEMEIKTAPVDQDELKAIIGQAVEEAKANDPTHLKAKIRDLEKLLKEANASHGKTLLLNDQKASITELKQLKKQLEEAMKVLVKISTSNFDPTVPKEEIEKAVSGAVTIAVRQIEDKLTTRNKEFNRLKAEVDRALNSMRSLLKNDVSVDLHVRHNEPFTVAPAARAISKVLMSAIPEASKRREIEAIQQNGDAIGGGMRRMMIALAQRDGLTKRQLGVRAVLSSTSGTFGTYLAKLRANGWVADAGGTLILTPDGHRALGDYTPLPVGRDLYQFWKNDLGGGASRMLEALFENYPTPMTKEELGERAGISHTSGTFGTYLAKLRTLELVTGKSELLASAEFFE